MIGAEIDLDDCIDMLDIPWEGVMVAAYHDYAAHLTSVGTPIPKQTQGAHRLDRSVLNYLTGRLAAGGMRARSVRAVFPEGQPMYPDSALWSRAHVQIAVRDLAAIARVWHQDQGGS